jgi:hypothetical protein
MRGYLGATALCAAVVVTGGWDVLAQGAPPMPKYVDEACKLPTEFALGKDSTKFAKWIGVWSGAWNQANPTTLIIQTISEDGQVQGRYAQDTYSTARFQVLRDCFPMVGGAIKGEVLALTGGGWSTQCRHAGSHLECRSEPARGGFVNRGNFVPVVHPWKTEGK